MENFIEKIEQIIKNGNHSGLTEKASSYFSSLAEKTMQKFKQAPWEDEDFDYVFSMLAEDAEYCDVDGDEWTEETALEYIKEIFTRKVELDVMSKAFEFMKELDKLDISAI